MQALQSIVEKDSGIYRYNNIVGPLEQLNDSFTRQCSEEMHITVNRTFVSQVLSLVPLNSRVNSTSATNH